MAPGSEEGWTQEVRGVLAYNRRLIYDELEALEGAKTIVWDRAVMQRVNAFTDIQALRVSGGVETMSALEQLIPVRTPHALFFLSPTTQAVDKLCAYLNEVNNENTLNHVYFIPEEWYVAKEKLKSRKEIARKLETIRGLGLFWLPTGGDTIHLGERSLVSRVLLNGNWTALHKCAAALFQLEQMVGQPLPIFAKGKWANDVANMIVKLRQSADDDPSPSSSSVRVGRLVLIDRWVDPLTPLLTPLTYSAMLDNIFGIGIMDKIKVLEHEYKETEENPTATKIDLNLNDELFHQLKHIHINGIGMELAGILKEIRQQKEVDKDKTSAAEYKLLVKKLPGMIKRTEASKLHMRLAEMIRYRLNAHIVDQINDEKRILEGNGSQGDEILRCVEDSIVSGDDPLCALRWIAIQSTASGGLKSSVLQAYRRMVYQSFGVDALNRLLKMQMVGLIREKGGTGRFPCKYPPLLFPQQAKAYNLLPDQVAFMNPTDAAYAYGNYASLLVRMIEEGAKLKWTGWKSPPGTSTLPLSDGHTVLFVVGGVTRAEVAALRAFVPEISLIASSAILTADSLIDSLTDI